MRHKGLVVASGVALVSGFATVAFAIFAAKIVEEFVEDLDFSFDLGEDDEQL